MQRKGIEWTERQKEIARRLIAGDSTYKLKRAGMTEYAVIRKTMDAVIAQGLPKPWVDATHPEPPAVASVITSPPGNSEKGNGDKPEDSIEVPIVSFDNRGDGDKASSSPRVKDTPPARNIKGSLFKVRMRGIDLEVTVEELLDIMELYWAFREEGYVGTPLALAKRCMVKMANLMDVKPKLYLEVLNG